jgi:hypothetical protein
MIIVLREAVARENPALPVVPVVAAGTTVTAALEVAQAWSARAVVELAEKFVRLHAAAALLVASQNGEGRVTLDRLPAIEMGGRGIEAAESLYPGGVVALGIGLAAPPQNLAYRASIMAFQRPMMGGGTAGVVTRAYKCPTDGEKFNQSGRCDRHDVDLVPDDDN